MNVYKLITYFAIILMVMAVIMSCNEKKDEWITTESGLKYKDLVVGEGATPQKGQQCVTHYTLWLDDRRTVLGLDFRSPPAPQTTDCYRCNYNHLKHGRCHLHPRIEPGTVSIVSVYQRFCRRHHGHQLCPD